jgi:hypothetical protein
VSEEAQQDRAAAFQIGCRCCLIDIFNGYLEDWWNMDERKMVFMSGCPRTRWFMTTQMVDEQGDD